MNTQSRNSADDSAPLDRIVARAAAQWLAHLHSGEATTADLEACDRWRAAHPEHERAWQRAERLNQKLGLLPRQSARAVLDRKSRMNRRSVVKNLTLLLTAAPAGYLSWQGWEENWLGSWTAAEHTTVGEQRHLDLADGSRVHLNTATALDVQFNESRRHLVLHRGEILVETADDTRKRPFSVGTRQGTLQAHGTRFVVRQLDNDSNAVRLDVMEGAVAIRPQRAPAAGSTFRAGEQVRFTADSIGAVQTADTHVADWVRGVLFANHMRLDEFAAELGRYRSGFLRCDPTVADLRISGAFQLNNTENVLASLPDTLPVQLVYRTQWWVTISAPSTSV